MRRSDYSDRRRDDDYPRGDDEYLRRPPQRQYGSNEQGYSDLPAHERTERMRHLSARHGNPEERLPREIGRGTWGGQDRGPDEEWMGLYVEEWRWPASGSSRQERSGDGRPDPRREPGRYPMYGLDEQRERERGYGRGHAGYRRSEGPRNYRRADDRIEDDVCTRLAHEHGLDVSEVTVHVRDGVVTMEGTVNDRRSKYEIEDIAESVFGVREVLNHIHVHRYGMLASE
ncbi:BON domain-containing protein [Cupriavidus sp. WKF15]|uniref:BON domain-containing protein n=1 Tax=Cupriavidus sp. WKF15 TaxID=3032282 RepID=UPI0023E18698|nr:BON domain-containing protein [Cupriavidus sp. WKF15]WER48533.1 BON domain-containing protein [Cupriavidus sp. WKF15]